jgi:hypothetical protein
MLSTRSVDMILARPFKAGEKRRRRYRRVATADARDEFNRRDATTIPKTPDPGVETPG